MREELLRLLNRLLVTHSPAGVEGEIDAVIHDELARLGVRAETDPHGSVLVRLPGRNRATTRRRPVTVISAHKDELSVAVRRIDADGRMWLEPVGGSRPYRYGEGPFDLLTRDGAIEGVLCLGSGHSSDLSARTHRATTGPVTWDMVYLDCKLSGEELAARGVRVGDRAVIGRRRKPPMFLGRDFVAGYALDDKAAVAVLLLLVGQLRDHLPAVPRELVLAFTAAEEGGCSGGSYVSRHLDPHEFIAVEIAPVADEYPTRLSADPVLLLKDAIYHYTASLTDELVAAGRGQGIVCQTAVIRNFGSDASVSLKDGLTGRAACLCFATENTHGYEITRLDALENCVRLLAAYLGAQAPAKP